MKRQKSSLVLVSIVFLAGIWGFVFAQRAGIVPGGLELFIFLLIMSAGVYAFVQEMKRHKDIENGFPPEDELSEQIKYRAGYLTFMTSIYIWLALFLLKEWFKDYDTLFGLGVLLPALLFMGIRSHLSRNFNEDAH